MNIIFMGTAEFAVPSLEILIRNNYNIVAVITSPDKFSGRGMHKNISPVKKYALVNKLNILQPENLKSEAFINELKKLNADLQIVVAFRMLPEIIYNMPTLGSFNLHPSLLPQYRGPAPINWVIINGETETGLTTFFIQKEIDTGKIIFQQKIFIGDDETAGELHDRLMIKGADLVLKTLNSIEKNNYFLNDQKKSDELKYAPKIFKQMCKIDFNKSTDDVYNFIRGLSPYPGSYTHFQNKILKIYKSNKIIEKHSNSPGEIIVNKYFFRIATLDGFIEIQELQIQDRKKMNVKDFLNGINI